MDEIRGALEQAGAESYFGEDVSQLQHALQSAHLAEREGVGASSIVAALLHDVGHALSGLSEDVAAAGIDGRHEVVGASFLSRFFGASVTAPVRHHVDAKRWLCVREPGYHEGLSQASRLSLELQGGPMDDEEVREFEQRPFWDEAVKLRRFDDRAKVPGLDVPGFEHYESMIAACLEEAS